jgi:hypothetical protein
MISPAIGTRVELRPNGNVQARFVQIGLNTPDEQQLYAIVAGVVSNDAVVNLTYFGSQGGASALANVPLVAVGGTPPARPTPYAQMI